MTEPQWMTDMRGSELYLLALTDEWPGSVGLLQLKTAIEWRKSILLWPMAEGLSTPDEFAQYDGPKLELAAGTDAEHAAKLVATFLRTHLPEGAGIRLSGADYEGVSDV